MGSPISDGRKKSLAIAGFSIVAVLAVYVWMTGFLGPKTGITEGQRTADFSVSGLDRQSFTLSKHRGEVVVLEFMTTWCGFCGMQIGELKTLQENVEGVLIASIEVDPTLKEEAFEAWATGKGFEWFVGHSPEAGRIYKVTVVPTVIVVDKEGIIRYRGTYTSSDKLETIVRQHM